MRKQRRSKNNPKFFDEIPNSNTDKKFKDKQKSVERLDVLLELSKLRTNQVRLGYEIGTLKKILIKKRSELPELQVLVGKREKLSEITNEINRVLDELGESNGR